jgi:hypothetical protein
MREPRAYALLPFLLAAAACGTAEGDTHTLYRSSVVLANARIHVATFDAKGDAAVNQENCDIARDVFAKQPGVTVRWWCEKGRFKE